MPVKKSKFKKFVKKVNKFMANNKAEVKHYSLGGTTGGAVQVGPVGSNLRLTQMTSATAGTVVGKIGDEVRVTGLRFHFKTWMTATTGIGNVARVILVYDRDWQGVALSNGELLANFSTSNATYVNTSSDYNPAYVNMPRRGIHGKRIDILYDRIFQFGTQLAVGGMGANGYNTHQFTYNKVFKRPKLVTYDSVTGDATATGGQLYAYFFIGNNTTDTINPAYYYHSQVFYTDA